MSALKIKKNELISKLFWQMEIGADEAILLKPSPQEKMVGLREYFSTLNQNMETETIVGKVSSDSLKSGKSVDGFDSSIGELKETLTISNDENQLEAVKSLKELRVALELFDGCSLKNTANRLVFSDGNADAKIMIIGEAPGKEEDKIGVPFVGQAGQLLDKMLNSIELDRSHTYIINYIPWRPPGNRTPSQEEIGIFKPFIIRHIQLKKPKLILALGGVSSKALLELETGIVKLRGQFHLKDFGLEQPIPVLPTLHPAYLLRSPAQKKFVFADLVKLKRALLAL